MKWRNKGHEFDNIGEILKKIDNIYIYGAGEYGEQLGRLFQGVGASYTYIDRKGYHITITLPEYAAYLNDGTKPHWPPVDKIREWIKVKPVLPRPGRNGKLPSTEQLAYLIGRKISKVGTKPTKIIDRTINDFDLINKLVSHLEQELAKELSEL